MNKEFIQIGCEDEKQNKFVETLYLIEDEFNEKVYESSKYRIVIDKVDNGVFHIQVLSRPIEGKIISCSWNYW